MRCNSCGLENDPQVTKCVSCGTELCENQVAVAESPSNPIFEKMSALIADKLFLASCIILTVISAIGMITNNFNIINVLATVFIWLLYSKGKVQESCATFTRCLSGTTYATYLITNILSSIIIVVLIIIAAASFAPGFVEGVRDGLTASLTQIGVALPEDLAELFSLGNTVISTVITIICVCIVLLFVLGLVLNVVGFKKIHRFIKSVHESISAGEDKVVFSHKAYVWLTVFCVIKIVSNLGSLSGMELFSIVDILANAALLLIASLLVKKHFNS